LRIVPEFINLTVDPDQIHVLLVAVLPRVQRATRDRSDGRPGSVQILKLNLNYAHNEHSGRERRSVDVSSG
jgi:hypothetical protein